MLPAKYTRLLLHLFIFWYISGSLLQEAELKAVTENMVISYEDWNNITKSIIGLEFYISSLKFTLMKLETENSRLQDNVNKVQAEDKQLKSDFDVLKLRFSVSQKYLTECQENKNKTTVFIKGLRKQIFKDIKLENWSRSIELMKRHLDQSTLAYEQLNNISQLSWNFPLEAAERGYVELVKVMSDNGLPIKRRYFTLTMLHKAADYGHYKLAKFLIQRGAEVNVRDRYGSTPLHYAAGNCYVIIVQLLVESGSDINTTNKFGYTPFNWASRLSCYSVVKYLETIKFNITTASDKWGETTTDVSTTVDIL